MGTYIDERIGSTGGKHKGYMDVGPSLCSRAITDAGYRHVISASCYMAAEQDDVTLLSFYKMKSDEHMKLDMITGSMQYF